ncbi:WD40 repeat-like protein [Mycena olivaceomarginata]|nr:WD40 repeat-like protein [Mycena olivaceomarginata]
MTTFQTKVSPTDDAFHAPTSNELLSRMTSEQECEVVCLIGNAELAYKLLASLPRSRLATIQRRLAPLLQFDVVGSLPAEVSLQIFSHLPAQTLLTCALVSRRWRALANDQAVWKKLVSCPGLGVEAAVTNYIPLIHPAAAGRHGTTTRHGLSSTLVSAPCPSHPRLRAASVLQDPSSRSKSRTRHNSAPPVLSDSTFLRPDYKRLHQTHTRLQNRVRAGAPHLSAIQTRGGPSNAHTTTIYCLQLYTYPATGSRDRTVREWNLTTGLVERVISGVHASSVLSICVHDGFVASAGSDRRVAIIADHEDSVLCVRLDGRRLVSCSKDRTFVLGAHRAAVNAVSLSDTLIVSGSGDRSVRLWDATTGKLLRTFENHHTRGIASIDFMAPYVVSGSSDKHLRLFDITTFQGWSTSPEYDVGSPPAAPLAPGSVVCSACGSTGWRRTTARRCAVHSDLVRSVALGPDFVLSGSYDLTIKVWDRKTGALVADLTGGHSGRIFCIGFDCTKIVSCGEDQRICVWDFSHGIDTSFIQL